MRLKAHIWVKAFLRRCQAQGCFAAVARHGDDDAGSIYIRINLLDGRSKLFVPAPMSFDNFDDTGAGRLWMPAFDQQAQTDAKVETYIQQQMQLDSDFWVVEVEDRDGRDFLGDELYRSQMR
ncbi:MAG: DUF1491 family protein [Hyphomicrobiaceae bacterium]